MNRRRVPRRSVGSGSAEGRGNSAGTTPASPVAGAGAMNGPTRAFAGGRRNIRGAAQDPVTSFEPEEITDFTAPHAIQRREHQVKRWVPWFCSHLRREVFRDEDQQVTRLEVSITA